MTKLLSLLVPSALSSLAQAANWMGLYRLCFNSAELKRTVHLSIGVRYDLADLVVARQFHRAFGFWSTFLMQNSMTNTRHHARSPLSTGARRELSVGPSFPNRPEFYGSIAADRKASTYLADDEAVAIWIHKIGHLLGLKHNPSTASRMYYMDADAKRQLDGADLRALASLQAFRMSPNSRVGHER